MTQAAPSAKIRKSDSRKHRGGKSGFTTGACAAAAARAAAQGLLDGRVPEQVRCRLPNGRDVDFPVVDGQVKQEGSRRSARAIVVKDAGDDPDVTHGARVTVDICLIPDAAGTIALRGGDGVGTVTREGIGLAVGEPAINPVPRRNIQENLREVGSALLERDGLDVVVSIPGGDEMAKRTLNPRLGILGGISILGTTGIVRPYSTAAFRASVAQAASVAARQQHVVFTTGGRSERFAMEQLPELHESCFVQMGDFVKTAFTTAIKHGARHLYVGAMAGKLTKMAQGMPVTHAWRAEIDRDLIASCALEVNAPAELVALIREAETARFAAERLAALGLTVRFHRALAKRAILSLKSNYPGDYRLTVLACDFEGLPIVRVEEEEAR